MRIAIAAACCCALAIGANARALAEDYAPSDLTAPQVLAKAKAAYGELKPGAYLILSHSHGGGVDRTYVTHVNGENVTTVETSGPFVESYGAYDGQAWSQNENGTVLLRSNVGSHVDPNARAWAHPEDPNNHVNVLGLTKGTPREYVVEAKPPYGVDQYRYYNAETMLLDRGVTYGTDQHTHVIVYDDYRSAFGQTRAYRVRSSDGRTDNDTEMWTDSIAPDASTASLDIPVPRALYRLASSAPVEIPSRFTPAGIVVRATVAGRGLDFLLDSGSQSITIDPGVAHDLGLLAYGKSTATIGGEIDVSRTKIEGMNVGTLALNDVAASVIPMGNQGYGSRLVGLMGCDFFAGAVVGIDFVKETVTLYPRSAFDPVKVGATAQSPIDVNSCVPRLPVTVEGVAGSFLVDTGSFTTIVYNSFLAGLPEKHYLANNLVPAINAVGGRVATSVYEVSDVGFGPILFKRVNVVVPNVSTFDISGYDGIFGRNILGECAVFLDYADRIVYFKPEVPQ